MKFSFDFILITCIILNIKYVKNFSEMSPYKTELYVPIYPVSAICNFNSYFVFRSFFSIMLTRVVAEILPRNAIIISKIFSGKKL